MIARLNWGLVGKNRNIIIQRWRATQKQSIYKVVKVEIIQECAWLVICLRRRWYPVRLRNERMHDFYHKLQIIFALIFKTETFKAAFCPWCSVVFLGWTEQFCHVHSALHILVLVMLERNIYIHAWFSQMMLQRITSWPQPKSMHLK